MYYVDLQLTRRKVEQACPLRGDHNLISFVKSCPPRPSGALAPPDVLTVLILVNPGPNGAPNAMSSVRTCPCS